MAVSMDLFFYLFLLDVLHDTWVKKFTLIKTTNQRTMYLSCPVLLMNVNIPYGQCACFGQIEPFEKL
jgi:hypothetical protein